MDYEQRFPTCTHQSFRLSHGEVVKDYGNLLTPVLDPLPEARPRAEEPVNERVQFHEGGAGAQEQNDGGLHN